MITGNISWPISTKNIAGGDRTANFWSLVRPAFDWATDASTLNVKLKYYRPKHQDNTDVGAKA